MGFVYKVKRNFFSGLTLYRKGLILRYLGGAYSHYDDCNVYNFSMVGGGGKNMELWVDSECAASYLTDRFEELPFKNKHL